MENPSFDIDTIFPDGTTKPQNYMFCNTDDQIGIGPFTLTKIRGKWCVGFDTRKPELVDVASTIVLPSEISRRGIAIIQLKKIKISSTGNIEFELESTTGRASGGVRKFTITPNSVKFRGKEIPVSPKGEVMNVRLPKNFMQLFLSNDPACSIKGKLPQEFFQTIVANKNIAPINDAFAAGVAEHRTMKNADSSKSFDILRVGDKKYTLLDGKMAEIEDIFHIRQDDGREIIGCVFVNGRSKVARILKNVESHEAEEFAKIFLGSSFSPSLWNDESRYLYKNDTLATKGLTETEFKSRESSKKSLTSDGLSLTPPTLIEQKAGHWFINGVDTGYEYQGKSSTLPSINDSNNWDINGVDTGVRAKALDRRTAVIPKLDSLSGNLVIGSFDAGVNLDGEIPPIPYIDSTSKTWIINGIDTGLSETTKLTIKNNEWREDDGSPNGKEIATLTNKSSIGKDGPQISIHPTLKTWMVDGVDTGELAEVKDLATKIEQSDDGYWIIDGVKTNQPCQGPKGTDGIMPVIGTDRKYIINGAPTDLLGMTKDGNSHPQPSEDENGFLTVDGYTSTKHKLKGEDGKLADIPTVDPSSGCWKINNVVTSLNASTTKLKPINNEWRADDGSLDGLPIPELSTPELATCVGEKGKDGVSPTVNANGDWQFEDEDTKKPAVMKEQENKKNKDPKNPFVFPASFLTRFLGIFVAAVGILTGNLALFAAGCIIYSTPKVTTDLVNDYRAYNEEKEAKRNKSNQKAKIKAIIKQRKRDLKLAHSKLRNKALTVNMTIDENKEFRDSTKMFRDKGGKKVMESDIGNAIKNLDLSKIPIDKIENTSAKLVEMKEYIEGLKRDLNDPTSDLARKVSSDPTLLAEITTSINDAETSANTAIAINTTMHDDYYVAKAMIEKAKSGNLTPEETIAGFAALGIDISAVYDPSSDKAFYEDSTMMAAINNKIEEKYTDYKNAEQPLLSTGGALGKSLGKTYSVLDRVRLSSRRTDYSALSL